MNTNGKKEEAVKFISGAFFLVGIVLFVLFVFTIGRDKGLAQSKFQIAVLFNNVGGLNEGAPTLLSGVNVGTVGSIDFLNTPIQGRRVKVTLNIFSKFRRQLEHNIHCVIKTQGVLGEKILEISVVEGEGKSDLSMPLIGEDPLDVQDIAQSFAGAAKSFTNISAELNKVDMVELSQTMEESSEALLVTAKGINSIMDQLQEITVKTKRLLDRIENKVIEGNLFKVF